MDAAVGDQAFDGVEPLGRRVPGSESGEQRAGVGRMVEGDVVVVIVRGVRMGGVAVPLRRRAAWLQASSPTSPTSRESTPLPRRRPAVAVSGGGTSTLSPSTATLHVGSSVTSAWASRGIGRERRRCGVDEHGTVAGDEGAQPEPATVVVLAGEHAAEHLVERVHHVVGAARSGEQAAADAQLRHRLRASCGVRRGRGAG